jgi:alginate O-acetyltransferase complex protein AlgI
MAWEPTYIFLILFSTVLDYWSALRMGKEKEKSKRKKYLYLSLLGNLGFLFIFKYFNFFSAQFANIFDNLNIFYSIPELHFLLPVGISFYTFQTLSYTIDVYRGRKEPEKHFGIFALYVSFFPQLVAGPIERSTRLLPQFFKKISFDYVRVTDGLKLMLWGFFKKLVIADNLSRHIMPVFGNPQQFDSTALILATILFAYQLYCDFSGYSDIAIGAAQVLGYDLMDNFKRPFSARNISDFWRRWHISLTSWFQDYVFIPLYVRLSRIKRIAVFTPKVRHMMSFSIATLVGLTLLGLWHGANWTFIMFGLSQAIFIILYHSIKKYWDQMAVVLQIPLTFTMVLVGFVFFRARTITDAWYILTSSLAGLPASLVNAFDVYFIKEVLVSMNFSIMSLSVIASSIILLHIMHTIQKQGSIRHMLRQYSLWTRWGLYYAILVWIALFGYIGEQPFIYFQF